MELRGRIQISLKMRKDEGKEYLAAAVADEGPGFSRQDLTVVLRTLNIFYAFYGF